jgi:hypothetical protein
MTKITLCIAGSVQEYPDAHYVAEKGSLSHKLRESEFVTSVPFVVEEDVAVR